MDLGLTGKVVLVTGGSGGIGAELARTFAAEGAKVAVTYRANREAAEEVARECGPDRGLAVHYDLTELASVDAAVETVERHWGPVDVLVANAISPGALRKPGKLFEELPTEDCASFINVNIAPVFHTVAKVLPGMRAKKWGRIAFISSRAATAGKPGREAYGAVKSALHGFATSLAWDVGRDGVLVNTILPGLTVTPRVAQQVPAEMLERERAITPSGRLSCPGDVAQLAVFLCSAANGNTNGQFAEVSGGR
ncbi:short-chain dehydrogenase [Amycolatopsis sp. A1MSW2902]|uniref:SDR family NAD(P)-dependent oxidoreductase n=1 Tax=Amycolatopsis nivea TaxID=1644109 RepID=UPI00106F33FE|nr:SDR family oxidoreductase [Amycolatopsis nivea]